MDKLKKIITKNLTGKKVLWLFITTNVVYLFMLTITIPKTMSFSSGMQLLDMMPFGYSSEYVHALLDALGDKGREFYLYDQIPIDMIYPLLFGICYCLLIAYFLKKIHKLNSSFFYLCFLPLFAGIADYFENFGIIYILNSFPNLSPASIKITSCFSILKSISTTIYFSALIIILILLGIKTLRRIKPNATSIEKR